MKTQEDSLNKAIDLIVATPGRLLMHIEQGNMAYGDLKYVVSTFFSNNHLLCSFYFYQQIQSVII